MPAPISDRGLPRVGLAMAPFGSVTGIRWHERPTRTGGSHLCPNQPSAHQSRCNSSGVASSSVSEGVVAGGRPLPAKSRLRAGNAIDDPAAGLGRRLLLR